VVIRVYGRYEKNDQEIFQPNLRDFLERENVRKTIEKKLLPKKI
jgi:hypothetical protein